MPGFAQQLTQIITAHGVDPRLLSLELTEGVVLDTSDETPEMLNGLRSLGINVHLDDFGTGYSTLGCLRKFPIDVLKLDRSFVQAFGKGRKDASIVAGILSLARNLNMRVIAEGIENEGTLAGLIGLDCDLGQGFYFSRAVDAARAAELAVHGGGWVKQCVVT
jgi:EAL domain-containing protein (putative c-di-GMP-specific phosphodiesterase class I)